MTTEEFMSHDVKVSVAMITYNHEQFIAQAIESVVMQRTDFPVELVIGEDCSSDNTRAIVTEYGRRYPNRIRLLLPSHNLGVMPNFMTTIKACQGQYIALLEGDDYWTDPRKLQKQVDFLDSHLECSICFHDVLKLYEDDLRTSYRRSQLGNNRMFQLEDVLKSTISQTGSMMFRRDSLPAFPDWFQSVPLGDWALSVLLAERGKIGYLHDLMSVWRVHAGGVWTGVSESKRLKQTLQMYDLFNAYFGYRYNSIIEPQTSLVYYGLALDSWLRGEAEDADHWLSFVIDKFPVISDFFLPKAVNSLQEIESIFGYEKAIGALTWTCNDISKGQTGLAWCRKLRAAWYAAYAYKAHQRGNRAEVRSASWSAVRNRWEVLKNRGFIWRWLSTIMGERAWRLLGRTFGRPSAQPGERTA